MVRIRYKREEGLLKSKSIIAGTEIVSVIIDVNNKSIDILNNKEESIFNGYAMTVSKLKKIAKNELKNLGVVFGDESRNRKKEN